jgi:hypothetical protein
LRRAIVVAQHVKKVATEPLIRLRYSVAKAFGQICWFSSARDGGAQPYAKVCAEEGAKPGAERNSAALSCSPSRRRMATGSRRRSRTAAMKIVSGGRS